MRCAWLGEASKATFFFLLSDSDLIEPFVSGQFDVYIESLRSITVGQGCRFWTNILINPRQPQYFIHTHTHPGHFGGVSIVFISFISYISFFFLNPKLVHSAHCFIDDPFSASAGHRSLLPPVGVCWFSCTPAGA